MPGNRAVYFCKEWGSPTRLPVAAKSPKEAALAFTKILDNVETESMGSRRILVFSSQEDLDKNKPVGDFEVITKVSVEYEVVEIG